VIWVWSAYCTPGAATWRTIPTSTTWFRRAPGMGRSGDARAANAFCCRSRRSPPCFAPDRPLGANPLGRLA
jgi:hypothetical protein